MFILSGQDFDNICAIGHSVLDIHDQSLIHAIYVQVTHPAIRACQVMKKNALNILKEHSDALNRHWMSLVIAIISHNFSVATHEGVDRAIPKSAQIWPKKTEENSEKTQSPLHVKSHEPV